MFSREQLVLVVIVVFAVGCHLASSQTPGCPTRCLCFHRNKTDNGMVVRCMFVGLTEIPNVPRDTTILDLRFNRISSISNDDFDGLNDLSTLLLNSNEITEIPAGVFRGLRNLKYLYLYKNKIESLQTQAFIGLNRLEQLYIHSNLINHLDVDVFSILTALQRLFLHNNKLKIIPEQAIRSIPALTRLRLDSNPIVCNCSMKWLKDFTRRTDSLMEVAATCDEPLRASGVDIAEVDDDIFGCSGSNRIPPVVLSRRPQLTTEPTDVQIQPGERAYLRCNAIGMPLPQIQWFHNENEIITNDIEPTSRYSILPNGTLMIERAQRDDQGSYECMAQNIIGEAKSGVAMLIMDNNYIESPEFVLKPRDQIVSLGGSVSLTCTASGSGEITWYKDGRVYELDRSRSTQFSSGTMLITDVKSLDAGLYRCTVRVGNQAAHASAEIIVREGPYFTEEPRSVSVVQGGIAYFNCEVAGYPLPEIIWYKNGRTVQDSLRFSLTRNNTNLRITDVQRFDAGNYECRARNSIGSISARALLAVRTYVPPTITSRPGSDRIVVEKDADIELLCTATGEPDPSISWYRNGRRIQADEEEKYSISSAGFLTVHNAADEDQGSYECHARNSIGSTQTVITLQLIESEQKVYPGDRFVEEAVAIARSEVNQAANQTLRELRDRSKPLSPSDLLALFKFPSPGAQSIARAAEIFERTLELIANKVHEGYNVQLDDSDIYRSVRNILSPRHIRTIAELSGCAESRTPIDCTDLCFHMKYRSLDGTCNSLHHPMWGSSLTKFKRWLPAIYENNFNFPVGWNASKLYHGFAKPSARLVSTEILSSHEISADDRFTSFLMQWGQFLDHDITLTPMSVSRARFSDGRHCNSTCQNQAPCFPIQTPAGDPRLRNGRCIGVTRSSAACGTGMTSVFFNKISHREQLNELTAFIDASNVYGSDQEFANTLRNRALGRGLLRTGLLQTTSGKHLLPFNVNAPMDCQVDATKTHVPCFMAGDLRANEQLGLLAMHTLFMREHNRIANELSEINSHWDSDMIYHETRKIIGALMQRITYEHWLPYIIGPVGMSILGEYKGYNPRTEPSIMNVFATAAFRFGHSLINPILYRFNSTMQETSYGHLPLHKAFFAPFRLIEEGGIDPIIRGLFGSSAKMPMPSQVMNQELTEKLFRLAHSVALDLAALNVQRGRDHALPGYNDWRQKCGMNAAMEFDDLSNEIPDVKIRMKLEQIYGHPGNIDLIVGGLTEKLMPGARVGPTFMCILTEQFKRLRDGDRFFYKSPGVFTPDQLSELNQVSLASVICDSSDSIAEVPTDVFITTQYPSRYTKCTKIAKINLKVWAECCKDCTNAGDFRSITDSVTRSSRGRRSVDYSYPEDQPEVLLRRNDDSEKQKEEERLEGLEETVQRLSNEVNKLTEKIISLQSKDCEYENTIKKDEDQWQADVCTACKCKSGQVICSVGQC